MSLQETINKGLSLLKENPRATVFAEVADSYRKMGEYSRAIEVARNGVVHNPNFFPGKLVLARSLFENGDLDESEKLLKDLFRFSPENVHILRILGQISFTQNKNDQAKLFLTKLLELDPSDTFAQEQLTQLKNPGTPVETPAPEKAPAMIPPATITLAKMYLSQNLVKEAKATLFEILSVNPDHVEAKTLLADLEKSRTPAAVQTPPASPKSPRVEKLTILLERIQNRRKAA